MIDKVYYSDNIEFNNQKRLLSLARSSSIPAGYFVITLSEKEDQLLVSYCHADVNRRSFHEANHTIVGIAKGRRHANELIRQIIDDACFGQDAFDIKSYVNGDK